MWWKTWSWICDWRANDQVWTWRATVSDRRRGEYDYSPDGPSQLRPGRATNVWPDGRDQLPADVGRMSSRKRGLQGELKRKERIGTRPEPGAGISVLSPDGQCLGPQVRSVSQNRDKRKGRHGVRVSSRVCREESGRKMLFAILCPGHTSALCLVGGIESPPLLGRRLRGLRNEILLQSPCHLTAGRRHDFMGTSARVERRAARGGRMARWHLCRKHIVRSCQWPSLRRAKTLKPVWQGVLWKGFSPSTLVVYVCSPVCSIRADRRERREQATWMRDVVHLAHHRRLWHRPRSPIIILRSNNIKVNEDASVPRKLS